MIIISDIFEFITVLAVLAAQEKVISFGRSQSLFTGNVHKSSTARFRALFSELHSSAFLELSLAHHPILILGLSLSDILC